MDGSKMKIPPDQRASNFLIQASLLYKDTCPELSRHLMYTIEKEADAWESSSLSPLEIKPQYHVEQSLSARSTSRNAKQAHIEQGPMQTNGSSKGCRVFLDTAVCSFCYQWLQPDNHRVRVRPKQQPSARVQRALHRQACGKHLSVVQKELVQQFYKSSSVLMATCHACNKTSRHKGMGREFITTLSRTHSTPGSTGKHKTPQSVSRSSSTTPKNMGKDKTPVHTPRASISTNTPGTGSASSKSSGAKGKNWVVQRLSKILMREDGQGKKKGGLKDFLSSL